ncbi:MAG: tannase/feruloyl esterase family alpha/beta hydrolase [Steroidobacteraceae bacterium]
MKAIRFLILPGLVTLALSSSSAIGAQSVGDPSARCKALENVDLSRTPDAVIQVKETKLAGSTDDAAGYCEVTGNVAPSVGFVLRLPLADWNGKFLELGCGGPCGTLEHIRQCDDPLRRGYACIVSDGGHKVNASEPMKWAYAKPQAVIEYVHRASHVTALAGKAIVQLYYGQAPGKSYFMGCSAGGMQAMWEAQRFPWDFDGIVAGGPALSNSRLWLNWLWANRAIMGADGKAILEQAELETLHQGVVQHCDRNDGVEDGLIGDPRACHFDPMELRCASDKIGRCLTAPQIEASAKIYDGPVTSKGEQIAAPIALRGSELTWSTYFVGSAANPTPVYDYFKEGFRWSIFEINLGTTWKPESFDFDRDHRRLGAMEALEPMWNSDLRRFNAAGGKLLAYTGWNDAIEGVLNTAEYYEVAERVTGGRAVTQDFFRLFIVPGMEHCGGGRGASVIDWLSYLEAWVELGQAPVRVIGAHIKSKDLNREQESDQRELQRRSKFPLDRANIEFSRPVYPYPEQAKYRGRGDQNSAESFEARIP